MPNIFFTEENFVLAFPLLAVCSIYVSKRDEPSGGNSTIVIVCENILCPHNRFTLTFDLSPQAFFKFIPLTIGLPIIAVISILIQARAKFIASEFRHSTHPFMVHLWLLIFYTLSFLLSLSGRSTDEHIDKTIVRDLVSDEDALVAKQEAKAEKKQRKATQKLR